MGEIGDDASLGDLEFGDIGRRVADTVVASYLVNRSVSGEFRDAERAVDCDVPKTHAKTNMMRRENGKNGANDSAMWKEVGGNPKICLKAPKEP